MDADYHFTTISCFIFWVARLGSIVLRISFDNLSVISSSFKILNSKCCMRGEQQSFLRAQLQLRDQK